MPLKTVAPILKANANGVIGRLPELRKLRPLKYTFNDLRHFWMHAPLYIRSHHGSDLEVLESGSSKIFLAREGSKKTLD